jgi:hypothetical protein
VYYSTVHYLAFVLVRFAIVLKGFIILVYLHSSKMSFDEKILLGFAEKGSE